MSNMVTIESKPAEGAVSCSAAGAERRSGCFAAGPAGHGTRGEAHPRRPWRRKAFRRKRAGCAWA